MSILRALAFASIVAVSAATTCHVSEGVDCGKSTGLTCSQVSYTPFCHATHNDIGICTCEKYCFDDSECATECHSDRYAGKCVDMYSGSIEKICSCVRKTT